MVQLSSGLIVQALETTGLLTPGSVMTGRPYCLDRILPILLVAEEVLRTDTRGIKGVHRPWEANVWTIEWSRRRPTAGSGSLLGLCRCFRGCVTIKSRWASPVRGGCGSPRRPSSSEGWGGGRRRDSWGHFFRRCHRFPARLPSSSPCRCAAAFSMAAYFCCPARTSAESTPQRWTRSKSP